MSSKEYKSPRFSKMVSLGDALASFVKENRLDKKLDSIKIKEVFLSSIPESSKKYIQRVDFSNGVLSVQVSSSSLRQNLNMAATSICEIMNEKLKQTIVHKILLR